MKAVVAAILLIYLAASANANCNLAGGSTGPIQAGGTAMVGPVCASLTSSCIHPGGSPYTCPGTDCCIGGGSSPDLASAASSNSITCTVTIISPTQAPGVNKTQCLGQAGLNTENSVYITYTPCGSFVGTAQLDCTSWTQGNDYSLGTPPAKISSQTYTFVVQAVTCASPCYGTCDPVKGCVCPAGLSGPNCAIRSGASSLTFSVAGLALSLVAVVFFNL